MNTLTRMALVAALAAAPLAACSQPEADRAGEQAENAAANAADAAGDAADATGAAVREGAAETGEAIDNATTTEETTVRAGDEGLEVRNTETQR